jgi:hypothetical protein
VIVLNGEILRRCKFVRSVISVRLYCRKLKGRALQVATLHAWVQVNGEG